MAEQPKCRWRMFISSETLDFIRSRVRIEDVVKRYVPSLKKRGKDYVGLCPFHQEKTPSFTVSPEKQIFYCFGCHAGGNVFSFISRVERLEFPESVKFLAAQIGIEINDERKGERSLHDGICRLNREAMDIYHRFLTSSAGRKGLEYLKGRGIHESSIDAFMLGFAPDSWDFLARSLRSKRTDLKLAEAAGLIRSRRKGDDDYYDVFRNRIMFPIFDSGGAVIAFGGRTIGDDPRKYLNSSESPVFKKKNVLYGLNMAKDALREFDRAVVVEGYLDVIGCHQAGIPNVVAPLGTALTAEQIESLSRHCNDIVFLFDADSAGMRAALRAIDVARDVNVNLRIGILPEGDPFEFVTSRGSRELMAIVDRAKPPADFRIERIMENLHVVGRVNALYQMFGVVRDLKLETERSVYLKKIASLLGVDETSVRADYRSFLVRQGIVRPHRAGAETKNADTRTENLDFYTRSYRELVRLVCHHPELVEQLVLDYPVNDIPDELSRNVLKKIIDCYYSDETFSIDKIFDFFSAGTEMDFLNAIINSEGAVQNPTAAYTEIYISIKLKEIDDKIDAYAASIDASPEYITEIEVLRREKEKLAQYLYNRVT